jgi:hypothetical protein
MPLSQQYVGRAARLVLDDAARHARAVDSGLRITTHLQAGTTAAAVAREAHCPLTCQVDRPSGAWRCRHEELPQSPIPRRCHITCGG